MTRLRPLLVVCALTALALLPAVTQAQWRTTRRSSSSYRQPATPWREATLAVGVLNYDFADDDDFPMAALRFDWRLTRYLRGELSLSYAVAQVDDPVGEDDDISASLGAATVGLRAELPTPFIRPYVGAALGLFGRIDDRDEDEGGVRSIRPTHAFPVGVRIPLSERAAIRGEMRWRFDQHRGGVTAVDIEKTAGLSFAF